MSGKSAYILDKEQWASEFEFDYSFRVRFGEIDGFGHVNNTRVFTYMEEARIAYFRSLGLMDDWGQQGSEFIPVVADLQCDYVRQILYGETVTVKVKMNEIGSSSFDLHYHGLNGEGKTVFTGRGRIVQISRVTGRPAAWDTELKEKFLQRMQKTKA
ncbi:acyl-CoA thioesterase [Fictibacillus iocasae]|uniref:Acyl-CoA thioesterase n=1 Tax=Fictibacillus iocasae TaxID=2715437 RepID=A0ABW2NPH3_9BACL